MHKRSSTATWSPILPAKKQTRGNEGICILCNSFCDEKQKEPQPGDWKKFQEYATKWRGLDKYGQVADTVDWDTGPIGKLWHKNCRAELGGDRKLQQAIKRSTKVTTIADPTKEQKPTSNFDDERPATRKSVGPVNDSSLCIRDITAGNLISKKNSTSLSTGQLGREL